MSYRHAGHAHKTRSYYEQGDTHSNSYKAKEHKTQTSNNKPVKHSFYSPSTTSNTTNNAIAQNCFLSLSYYFGVVRKFYEWAS